ncbi:Mov34/MPN/PAD-1 family protein [Plectosphaerella plurivora]|uniref:Mov34/MPN/PAD-1 family protein n=1 Tax=Plectosphaerella plurivora TaxID=936078 RepID=A0A9P8VBY0_9PEZI|nr:Mov34/MPN/PAD-1 family protein [Plectosphaerella plurivora]
MASQRSNRPMSSKELSAMADNFQFQHTIPFKYWARSADTLYQEARAALNEHDLRKAYVMLWRHSILVLQHLDKHPEAKLPENKALAKPLVDRQMKEVFKRLEQLKPIIDAEHEEWVRMTSSAKKIDVEREEQAPASYDSFAARDPTLSGNAKVLDAGDNQDLAVTLAQRDYRRRDAARRGIRQAGVSEEEELDRRKAGRWDSWDAGRPLTEEEDFQKQMEATRRRLDRGAEESDLADIYQPSRPRSPPPPPTHAYHYPTVSRSQPISWDAAPLQPRQPWEPAPSKPPKELLNRDQRIAPPSRPVKEPVSPYKRLPTPEPAFSAPSRPPKESAISAPPPKEERIAFRPVAYLENGDPIRSVFIPSRLRRDFLNAAAENTRQGLEMCGILCGRPINNALFVTCLVIPEQKCTTDTCETENEGSLLDYCISEDLLMLGWIHTHPTQTCFLSSRDMHTQAGYQVMMPESIAIVCAPRFEPSYGIFRLTNPPGLPYILNCNQTATFHTHSIDNIYTKAVNPPGHVFTRDDLDFYLHDLRPKR